MKHNTVHPRIVLYLGAGASYFAGYHTFVDFPELLFNSDLRNEEGMPPLSVNSERILQAIRNSLERNNVPTTHDNFLWRLDGYTQFLRLNQCDDALQEFLRENTRLYDLHLCTEQAIHQISTSTIHHYSSNKVEKAKTSGSAVFGNMEKVLALYRKLAALNGDNQTLPIFTTNYDMLIEDLVAEFSDRSGLITKLENGIPRQREQAAWNKNGFECYNRDNSVVFHLHRLHGCVCWFYHDEDSNIYFHRCNATSQQTDKLYAMYPGRERKRGVGPHGHSFRAFYQYLQECDLIVFIGFSFRDDDVMHVMLKALAERRTKPKILIVDRVFTRDDVISKLDDSSQRSAFPARLPKDKEIDSIKMRFGMDNDFDDHIYESCIKLLQ